MEGIPRVEFLLCGTRGFAYVRSRPGKGLESHFMNIRLSVAAGLLCGWAALGADLRLGIIGCDTSHVVAFTETLNNPAAKGHVPGAKVVAAYKGGSADIPASSSHVEGYSKTLQE